MLGALGETDLLRDRIGQLDAAGFVVADRPARGILDLQLQGPVSVQYGVVGVAGDLLLLIVERDAPSVGSGFGRKLGTGESTGAPVEPLEPLEPLEPSEPESLEPSEPESLDPSEPESLDPSEPETLEPRGPPETVEPNKPLEMLEPSGPFDAAASAGATSTATLTTAAADPIRNAFLGILFTHLIGRNGHGSTPRPVVHARVGCPSNR
ncbi:hypothetical protein P9209_25425 [Prescottella defluvii]|nr:hypothetical protein P9209_25425 [Prescottella defluvii]